MRFWDTSAVVPLFVAESASEITEKLLKEDETMIVWWVTRVECMQPLNRRLREKVFGEREWEQALNKLSGLQQGWSEMQPTSTLRTEALRLMREHPLRAADALQLAAAVHWREQAKAKTLEMLADTFVCLDKNLRTAAAKEGFQVLPEIFTN